MPVDRVYTGIMELNLIPFKTFFKTISIHFKTSSPLQVLTSYIGDTLTYIYYILIVR